MRINPMNGVQNIYRRQLEKYEKTLETKLKRDKIEISTEAKQLQQTNQMEKARQEKINHIKEQIESGNYKVDAKEVARKFYEFWTN